MPPWATAARPAVEFRRLAAASGIISKRPVDPSGRGGGGTPPHKPGRTRRAAAGAAFIPPPTSQSPTRIGDLLRRA